MSGHTGGLYWQYYAVQQHLDDLREMDMQITIPLTTPSTTSGLTTTETINAMRNLAGQARDDLDLLLADLMWIGSTFTSPPSAGLQWMLGTTSLSPEQKAIAAAWVETGPGLAAITASATAITFHSDKLMLNDYLTSLGADPPTIDGQQCSLSDDRIRCALVVLEGGVNSGFKILMEAGYRAYAFYESRGLSV